MNLKHIIESWRDEEYRESLNGETRLQLPENPAGEIELDEAELFNIGGADVTYTHTDSVTNTYSLSESVSVSASVSLSVTYSVSMTMRSPERP